MVLVGAFCPYTVKEHKPNKNIQFEAMDPFQLQIKALFLQDGRAGWLSKSRVRSKADSTAAAQWDTCP